MSKVSGTLKIPLQRPLTLVPTTKCMDILMDLLDRNKKEDNSVILSHMIETAKKNDFPALARIICRIDEGAGKNNDYVNSRYQFVEKKDSDMLKQKLLDKMDRVLIIYLKLINMKICFGHGTIFIQINVGLI